jgi:hypothetical protein
LRIKKIKVGVGTLLVLLSLAAIVQSVREYLLWESGRRAYDEESFLPLPILFAGHSFDIRDDQPRDTAYSETEHEGFAQWLRDGVPFQARSRALVRRGRSDVGRYHTWLDAWKFRDRGTGRTTLWLVRRLQPSVSERMRFEVITVEQDGVTHIERLGGWQLGRDFPTFRATQFIRAGLLAGVPLSMLDAFIFPPILLVFPLGSLALGVILLRRGRISSQRVAA